MSAPSPGALNLSGAPGNPRLALGGAPSSGLVLSAHTGGARLALPCRIPTPVALSGHTPPARLASALQQTFPLQCTAHTAGARLTAQAVVPTPAALALAAHTGGATLALSAGSNAHGLGAAALDLDGMLAGNPRLDLGLRELLRSPERTLHLAAHTGGARLLASAPPTVALALESHTAPAVGACRALVVIPAALAAHTAGAHLLAGVRLHIPLALSAHTTGGRLVVSGPPAVDLTAQAHTAGARLAGQAQLTIPAALAAQTAGAQCVSALRLTSPLILTAHTGGAHLIAGARLRTALVLDTHTAGARLSAGLQQGIASALSAHTRGAWLAVPAAYDPNLLSAVHTVRAAGWQGARLATQAARERLRSAPLKQSAGRVQWAPAPARHGAAQSRFRKTPTLISPQRQCGWLGAGMARQASHSAGWRSSFAQSTGTDDAWQDGRGANSQAAERWHDLPLARGGWIASWADANHRTDPVRLHWTDGAWRPQVLIEVWRAAGLPHYAWRTTPPSWPPVPAPSWTARLCLGWPLEAGRLSLGRSSCRPFPSRIARRRSYIMVHDIAVVRLPDRLPIDTASLTLSLDADAWAWSWSGVLLGRTALDAVLPTEGGQPVTLEVTLDDITWHLLVEDWQEDREFAKRTVRVSGRGLTAELASPAELPITGTLQQDRTLRQALAERIPLGTDWSTDALLWADGTPDWLLPAGCWSWSNVAPIQAMAAAVQAVGLVLVPGRATREVSVQPRYPVLPWDFFEEAGETALAIPGRGLSVPDSAILRLSMRQAVASQANAVYVHGQEVGGVLARVWRTGTAADRMAPTTSDPLITHVDAARLLGTRLLAAQERQPEVRSITLPLGGDFPLVDLGTLLAVEVGADEHRGIVNAVAIEVQEGGRTLRQTLTIGEDTPNVWARWRRLLPEAPLLAGRIAVAHGDGTVTVALVGGSTQRVRGSGVPGAGVWIRDGRVDGEAPTLPACEIEV